MHTSSGTKIPFVSVQMSLRNLLNAHDYYRYGKLTHVALYISGVLMRRYQKVSPGLAELRSAQNLICGSVLCLVQGLMQIQWRKPPRLWMVTRGAQSVNEEP